MTDKNMLLHYLSRIAKDARGIETTMQDAQPGPDGVAEVSFEGGISVTAFEDGFKATYYDGQDSYDIKIIRKRSGEETQDRK